MCAEDRQDCRDPHPKHPSIHGPEFRSDFGNLAFERIKPLVDLIHNAFEAGEPRLESVLRIRRHGVVRVNRLSCAVGSQV
jgi:hypothetical protein